MHPARVVRDGESSYAHRVIQRLRDRVDTGAMPKLPTMLPLDWNAAEVLEFSLIAIALITGAGAVGCNFTAGEEVLLGHNPSAWELAGAWCTWIATLAGSACLVFAFAGVGRGPKGKRTRRHASAQRYMWPEVGAQAATAKAKEPAARMDEIQQAELAQQLALVEAQGSLVVPNGPVAARAPKALAQQAVVASR